MHEENSLQFLPIFDLTVFPTFGLRNTTYLDFTKDSGIFYILEI